MLSSLPSSSSFSQDGQYIIGGSEDNYVYIWKTHHDVSKLSSARRDRNEYYESFSGEFISIVLHITPHYTCIPGVVCNYRYDTGMNKCTKGFLEECHI